MKEVLKNLASDSNFVIKAGTEDSELPILMYLGKSSEKKTLTSEEAQFFSSYREKLEEEKRQVMDWLDSRYDGFKIVDISYPVSTMGMIGQEIGNGYYTWRGNSLMIYKKDENKLYGIYVGKTAEAIKDALAVQINCLEILKKVNRIG